MTSGCPERTEPAAYVALARSRRIDMIAPEVLNQFYIPPGKKLRLKDHDPGWGKNEALKVLGAHTAAAPA
jgi:hypothetical protein